jgi:hypothetical protein
MERGRLDLGPSCKAPGAGRRLGAGAVFAVVFCVISAATSVATPYFYDWEGDQYPEQVGWTHHVYHDDGIPPATRTLQDGWMTIDGLASPSIADFCSIERPGQIDPGPGEEFVMQWRLRIDEIDVTPRDPGTVVFSDHAWVVGMEYTIDSIQFPFESYPTVRFAPYVPHSFELRSADMRTYDFYVDGAMARRGNFVHVTYTSHVGWGDEIVGAASRSAWNYFRFGAVTLPEPSGLAALVLACSMAGKRLSR